MSFILLKADYQKMYKYCLGGSMTLSATKVHKEVVFKSAIYTTSVYLTIKDLSILHNWPDKYV